MFFFDKSILYLMYFFSVIVFFNFNSCFVFWFWLEYNMVLFICLMTSDKSSFNELNTYSQSLYYFIIQSLASTIFLFLVSNENFYMKSNLVFTIFLFKLGVAPFHFWSFKISNYLNIKNLFFILNVQKIPSLIFILSYDFYLILTIMVFNMLVSLILLLKSVQITEFLVSSSLCFFSWMVFIFAWSVVGFMVFMVKYFFISIIFLSLKNLSRFSASNLFFMVKIIFLLIFLMGIPPLIYFYFKFYLVDLVLSYSSFNLLMILWMFSFISLMCYFNFFIVLFDQSEKVYQSFQTISSMEVFMVIFIIISMILFS